MIDEAGGRSKGDLGRFPVGPRAVQVTIGVVESSAGESQDWTVKALREAGSSLLLELRGLGERTLRRRPAGDERSLLEIAAHLAESERLALEQIAAILGGRADPLPVRDVEAAAEEWAREELDAKDCLAEFSALRGRVIRLLWRLTEAEWRATGRHPYCGEITVERIAKELARHDLEHLWQVRRMKRALGWGTE